MFIIQLVLEKDASSEVLISHFVFEDIYFISHIITVFELDFEFRYQLLLLIVFIFKAIP